MAYKFQVGAATLSGSTKFEETLDAAGGIKLSGVSDTAIAVADDSILFRDADGTMKRDTVADLMTAAAGDGLVAASGVLKIDIADMGSSMTGAVADTDEFAISDGGTMKKVDFSVVRDAVFADVSGDATVAAGGALTIAADSVEGTMLNTNAADGSTLSLSSDSLSVLKVPNALSQGDGIAAFSYDGSGALSVALSASVGGAGLGYSSGVLSLDIDELGALGGTGVAQGDHFVFSDGGTEKKITFSNMEDAIFGNVSGDVLVAAGGAATIQANSVEDSMVNDNVATGLAGVGLSAASGVMAVDLNELTAADLASGDFLAFVDSDGSNATKKESVDDLATLFAGAGLAAASAVLSVQVSGALKVTSDKVGISGSFAGIGLSFDGTPDFITGLDLDLNELSAGAIADGDFLAFIDANDSNVTKKEAVADLATLFAGNGLVAASSILAVNTGKGLEIDSDVVKVKVAGSGGITRSAGGSSDSLAMDMNGLGAAAVDVGADSIAIIDADGSNQTKKESIADLMTAAAGTGLTAASGVLNAALDVALKADTDTLAVGLNYMANMNVDGEDTLNLPASSGLTVGDIIHVKAPSDCSGARTVKILKNGSQTIDGLTQVIIESPFGAVSMVYVAADTFRLI